MSLARRHSLSGQDRISPEALLSDLSPRSPKATDVLHTSTPYAGHSTATSTADDLNIWPVKLTTLSTPDSIDIAHSSALVATTSEQLWNTNAVAPLLASQSSYERSGNGLLDLPPEIRYQIYCHLPDTLISSRPLVYCLSTFKGRKQHCLSSVCRQIRNECLAIFYANNTWLIKLEYDIMHDAFKDWMSSIGDINAGSLRLLQISVRSRKFRPPCKISSASGAVQYACADGDATFKVDLSEKYPGGYVCVLRNDGTLESGLEARQYLANIMEPLWKKRVAAKLTVADWLDAMESFLLILNDQ